MIDNWIKQTKDAPLFQELLWSRPESKVTAGKLVIIGGNGFGFGAPGLAYNVALTSGVGICKALLPDAIKKTVSGVFPDAEFAPSNPSGSFNKQALADFLSHSSWGDAVLLAGDFGRNSETAVLLEKFVKTYNGPLTITQDAVDYFKSTPQFLIDREQTLIVLSLAQLQKFFIHLPSMTPIHYSMTPLQLVEALNGLTREHSAAIIVKHHDELFASFDGKLISQKDDKKVWRVETAARASVVWLQNPQKLLEAVATSFVL